MAINGTFSLVVEFRVKGVQADAFAAAVCANANASLAGEPGCRLFDVCRDPNDASHFLLYEVYDDEAAFTAHLESAHFKAFDAQVSAWVIGKLPEAWVRLRVQGMSTS